MGSTQFTYNFCNSRIARFLRQSFRQSVRRFRGESSPQNGDDFGGDSFSMRTSTETRQPSRTKLDDDDMPPPPDYATVIIETSRHTNLPGSEGSYGR